MKKLFNIYIILTVRQSNSSSSIEPVEPWDWTYSTTYKGTSNNEFINAPDNHEGIPIHLLADTSQPILFYDDIQLFDDELGDNGQVSLNVKIVINFFSYKLYNILIFNTLIANNAIWMVCTSKVLPKS